MKRIFAARSAALVALSGFGFALGVSAPAAADACFSSPPSRGWSRPFLRLRRLRPCIEKTGCASRLHSRCMGLHR